MSQEDSTVTRMRSLVDAWEARGDRKAVFLRCYMMMTGNMLDAIAAGDFHDSAWVNRLLHRFADYYFAALDAYERSPEASPAVWQQAHNAAGRAETAALQQLLLGVNAHINYDLVLTLVDLLAEEWVGLSEEERTARYADHCRVNDVIGRTIDAVQGLVLEPSSPFLALVDTLLGRMDEFLISRLITHWREEVWGNATRLLEAQSDEEQTALVDQVQSDAVKMGELIWLI